jgi:hypothetical protein
MGGKASRDKGKRGEYAARNYLRSHGWKSERVPGSGAFSGRAAKAQNDLEHDVWGEKDDRRLKLEVKNHESFGAIYALYDEHCSLKRDDLLSFVCPGEEQLCLSASTNLDGLFDGPDVYEFQEQHPLFLKYKRTFQKLAGMQKLLKGADILVLKMNHKPLLFVRYR